jgi:ankyrin repeat protein
MEFCPLHNSVINGHFEAVRYLVENGADIQASGVVRLFIVPPLNVSPTKKRPYFLL